MQFESSIIATTLLASQAFPAPLESRGLKGYRKGYGGHGKGFGRWGEYGGHGKGYGGKKGYGWGYLDEDDSIAALEVPDNDASAALETEGHDLEKRGFKSYGKGYSRWGGYGKGYSGKKGYGWGYLEDDAMYA